MILTMLYDNTFDSDLIQVFVWDSHYLYSEIDKKSGNANNHSSRVSALLVPQVVDNRVGFA